MFHTAVNRFRQPRCMHPRLKGLTAAILLGLATSVPAHAEDNTLPSLGGVGGGLISEQKEAAIGEQVLRSLRRSTRQIGDPITLDYLSSIVYRLVPYAPLQNRDLRMVVIDSPAINAFAVPGGVIGVNGGLFLNARTEQQFAAVMAHELAHLAQRHYARQLEQQENMTPLTIAGMLAGIILSAATQSDVGIATVAGTQAMAVQNMLQYSRSNEQEADRVGLDIMEDAGLDPHGMPEMFEIMMRQSRIQGNAIPEYLSTHPLTRSRISDSRNRANQFPDRNYQDSLEYHLVRARLLVHYAQSPEKAVEIFQTYRDGSSELPDAAVQYGLAVAYLGAGDTKQAETILRTLLEEHPGRITFQVTLADTMMRAGKLDDAITLMQDARQRNPGNYPILYQLAAVQYQADHAAEAAEIYRELTKQYPDNAGLWQKLSDAEGQARNIIGVHRARAEFYLLMGDREAAVRQLREAREKASPGTPTHEIISQRLAQISRNRDESPL